MQEVQASFVGARSRHRIWDQNCPYVGDCFTSNAECSLETEKVTWDTQGRQLQQLQENKEFLLQTMPTKPGLRTFAKEFGLGFRNSCFEHL